MEDVIPYITWGGKFLQWKITFRKCRYLVLISGSLPVLQVWKLFRISSVCPEEHRDNMCSKPLPLTYNFRISQYWRQYSYLAAHFITSAAETEIFECPKNLSYSYFLNTVPPSELKLDAATKQLIMTYNIIGFSLHKLYFSIPLHCLCHKYIHCLPSWNAT
jgi:hypothetical protein